MSNTPWTGAFASASCAAFSSSLLFEAGMKNREALLWGDVPCLLGPACAQAMGTDKTRSVKSI
jgi:hypothetical protein